MPSSNPIDRRPIVCAARGFGLLLVCALAWWGWQGGVFRDRAARASMPDGQLVTGELLSGTEPAPVSESEVVRAPALGAPAEAEPLSVVEAQRRLRDALRRKAAEEPTTALAEALGLGEGEWQPALTAVIEAWTAQRPDALELVQGLCRGDPERSGDYGAIAISAFAAQKAHAAALRFAVEDASPHRGAWLQTASYLWAGAAPREVLQAVSQLRSEADRRVAYDGLISGWAAMDPASVVSYAVMLPVGAERTLAMQQALPQWVSRDPIHAAEWLQRHPRAVEFDAGVAALASSAEFVGKEPYTAVSWTLGMTDPTLRANALYALSGHLQRSNPALLQHLFTTASRSSPADSLALLNGLAATHP